MRKLSKRLMGIDAFIFGVFLLAWCAACTGPASTPDGSSDESLRNLEQPFFRDVAGKSGVQFSYRNGEEADGYTMLESLGGGLAVLDFDGDGRFDLFITGGGYFDGPNKQQIKGVPCKLYRNVSQRGSIRFEDVTRAMGLDTIDFYTHGAAVADYDNDGWPDLLVTGWHRLALFHNVPVEEKDPSKGRRFVDVSKQAGLPEGLWTTSAAFGDLDGDGYADLYLCQYVDWSFQGNHPTNCSYGDHRDVCAPKQFTGLEHKLYRNLGNGKFNEVSKTAGLRVALTDKEIDQLSWLDIRARQHLKSCVAPDNQTRFGKGLGVLLVDVNGDSKPDIYVANDTVDNFLYVNRGTKPGEFRLEEMGMRSGTARDGEGSPTGSMGLVASDFNGTERPSLLVSNFEDDLHALYRNDSTKDCVRFTFFSLPAGLGNFGGRTVGWGTGFLDLDHRGAEDLFIVTGHVLRFPRKGNRAQFPILARNENARFKDVTHQGGSYFASPHRARGAVQADFDNDGRIDLAITHVNEPVAILHNEAQTHQHHWLGVELVGKDHADTVGAKIVVDAHGRKQTRFIQGGGSYASSSDRRQVFGLGAADHIDRLAVVWPNGQEQTFSHFKLDAYYRLTQDCPKAEPLYEKRTKQNASPHGEPP